MTVLRNLVRYRGVSGGNSEQPQRYLVTSPQNHRERVKAMLELTAGPV